MEKLIINGARPLFGEVTISGFKNAALPVLFATIPIADISVIENLPPIRDVELTLEILASLGAYISRPRRDMVVVDTRRLSLGGVPDDLAASFRASSYLLGAALARFHKASVALPGGCRIGARPLDLHIAAFSALSVTVREEERRIEAEGRPLGGEIIFPTVSVGATVNAILAACLAEGETVIRGAAQEPHIAELCCFLNAAGAEIEGGGTPLLRIRGVGKLHGVRYRIMPDMIEAGSFLTFLGAVGGEITMKVEGGVHLEPILPPLCQMGITVESTAEGLVAMCSPPLSPFSLCAAPHPAFPTDMHPQMAALAAFSGGTSTMRDEVFPHRFAYVEELKKLGVNAEAKAGAVTVHGGARLHGGHVTACDLRAGAALVVAALGIGETTVIEGAGILERGYACLPEKLRGLGVQVKTE